MSEQKPRLGRDVYLALAAVGWADGTLDPDEADAIVRTAIEEGLELDEIEEIEAATKAPIDVGVIERQRLTLEDRLFVYGVACWLTAIDGAVSPTERGALERVGTELGIEPGPRAYVCALAHEVAEMPEGDRPARYDLAALRWLISERLRAAEETRARDQDEEED
ncbi:MAG: TerB family tellurite resistance protein [Polyangiaceae bacterium]|nr:TerB family tellurite resistance protein [Polyangiaceae bacterium]